MGREASLKARSHNRVKPLKVAFLFVCAATAVYSQAGHLPLEPVHDSGQSVTGAYEGWWRNKDGTFSLLVGYFNRNLKEELDVPIGPDNHIDPGGPDRGQPTHFLPRRQFGYFTVTVPKDFGTNKLTWTLVANHQPTVIPLSLDPLWEISPFHEEGMGNTPPVIRFEEAGPSVQGPRPIIAERSAGLSSPLTLTVWVADDAKAFANSRPSPFPIVALTWSKFRGPGDVKFSPARPSVKKVDGPDPFDGTATTSVTFTQPGEYLLHVVANDLSGDGGRGFLCCWTNGEVKVTVK